MPGAGESEHTSPLRARSHFVTACGSSGPEQGSFSKLDVLGAQLLGAVLKSWGGQCGVQTLCPSGRKLQVLSSLPVVPRLRFMERLGPGLSYLLWCGPCLPDTRSCSVFRFFSEEVRYLAADSVCPLEEVSTVSSYVTILNWYSLCLTLGKKNTTWKTLPRFSESMCVPPNKISVPLLMPLVTLMERQAVTFEGTDMWEKNDESCEIMLNHLATARLMAETADSYRMNAERILEGKSGFL